MKSLYMTVFETKSETFKFCEDYCIHLIIYIIQLSIYLFIYFTCDGISLFCKCPHQLYSMQQNGNQCDLGICNY